MNWFLLVQADMSEGFAQTRLFLPVLCAADEAIEAGAQVAICSTSNEKAVQKIVDVMLTEEASKIKVFAGDIVHNKKPDPAIYLLAAKELGVEPARYKSVTLTKTLLLSANSRCTLLPAA